MRSVTGCVSYSSDAARTKPSSRSPTNSCASPGRCSPKLSPSISPRRSARSRLDSNPGTPRPVAHHRSLAILMKETATVPAASPPGIVLRARVGVWARRFAAHHGAQHHQRCITTPDICPSSVPSHLDRLTRGRRPYMSRISSVGERQQSLGNDLGLNGRFASPALETILRDAHIESWEGL